MSRPLPILIVLALLGGCLGGEEPVTTESTDAPAAAPAAPTPTSPSTASAAVKPPSGTSSASTAENVSQPAQPVAVPFTWTDTLDPGACVPAGPNSCIAPLGVGSMYHELEPAGTLQHVKLTLTWTPSSLANDEMRFAFVVATPGECEGCWSGEAVGEPMVGVSPLELDLDAPPIEAGQWYTIGVRVTSLGPPPVYFVVNTEQAFDVAGSLTVLR